MRKRPVLKEQARMWKKFGEKNTDTTELQREQKKERVEERRGKPEAGRGELPCSRAAMEPNPTAVCTYYHKRNNSELGALPWLLSPQPTSH